MLDRIKQAIRIIFKRKEIVNLNVTYSAPNARFEGKKVVVTGGTSGIGLAIAKAFLAEGATVLICARKQEGLDRTLATLKSPNLKAMRLDISEISGLREKICEAADLLGGIDIFINAAGVSAYSGEIMSEQMYDYICDINQIEGDYFIDNKIEGKIINLTSKAGERIGFDPYTLSKWGANSITRGNARRLAPYHINVNGIAPGRVPTNITEELQQYIDSDNVYTPNHSTKRFTMPEEVAETAMFLASGAANNIVGQIIVMDGGSYN